MSGRKGFCQQSRCGDVLSLTNSFHVLDGKWATQACLEERANVLSQVPLSAHMPRLSLVSAVPFPFCKHSPARDQISLDSMMAVFDSFAQTHPGQNVPVPQPSRENAIIKDTFFWQTCSVLVCLDNSLTELCTPCNCVATYLCYPECHW